MEIRKCASGNGYDAHFGENELRAIRDALFTYEQIHGRDIGNDEVLEEFYKQSGEVLKDD